MKVTVRKVGLQDSDVSIRAGQTGGATPEVQ